MAGGGRKSHSKVTALPGPVKAVVDQLLAGGRHKLDDIVNHLRRLADDGAVAPEELPSRSGLHRYSQRFEAVASRMRLAKEVAETWRADILKDPESDVGQALLSMLETAAFEAGAECDGDTDADKLELLARAAKHIAQAKGASAKRILALKDKAEAERKKAVEAERAAAAERAETAARERGMSGDDIGFLRAQILGVKVEGVPGADRG